jgi:hypothetical protein
MPGASGTILSIEVIPGLGQPGPITQNNLIALLSTQDGLVAHAGGGQANATPILSRAARFATCATLNDSSLLPAAVAGLVIKVNNGGAANMAVFPQNNGDIINALAVNTAIAVNAGATLTFTCYTTGKWVTN